MNFKFSLIFFYIALKTIRGTVIIETLLNFMPDRPAKWHTWEYPAAQIFIDKSFSITLFSWFFSICYLKERKIDVIFSSGGRVVFQGKDVGNYCN